MLALLLWGVAALAGLVLGLVAMPVRLRIVAGTAPTPRLRLRLSLLGGLVPAIPLVDSARPRRPAPPAPHKPGKAAQARPRRRPRGLPQLAGAVLRAVRIRRLRLDADFGLGDPAETGIAYGLLMPVLHAGAPAAAAVSLRPDFAAARLSGRLVAEIGLVPARLLPPLLRFVLRNMAWRRR